MKRHEGRMLANVALLVVACSMFPAMLVVLGVKAPAISHDNARTSRAPVVSYCVEPHPPGTLGTFAPCRDVIRDSVWPL